MNWNFEHTSKDGVNKYFVNGKKVTRKVYLEMKEEAAEQENKIKRTVDNIKNNWKIDENDDVEPVHRIFKEDLNYTDSDEFNYSDISPFEDNKDECEICKICDDLTKIHDVKELHQYVENIINAAFDRGQEITFDTLGDSLKIAAKEIKKIFGD